MTEHPNNLIAWLDNELDGAESARIERHVELCPACRAQARNFAEISATIAETYGRRRRRVPVIAAVCGTIAAALALLITTHRPPPSEQPPTALLPGEGVVRVAFPAGEILPPGALPDSVSLQADVAISPDGSARILKVIP